MGDNYILIVGSIGLDTIETTTQKQENIIGGSTTYSLIAASRNIPVSIVGIIGKDFPDEGHLIINTYATNLEDLQIVEGKTFRWGGRYHENWDEKLLEKWKLVVTSLINYHYSNQQSPLRQITTEFITPTDYGGGFKYSAFENNVACAKWIKKSIKEIKLNLNNT